MMVEINNYSNLNIIRAFRHFFNSLTALIVLSEGSLSHQSSSDRSTLTPLVSEPFLLGYLNSRCRHVFLTAFAALVSDTNVSHKFSICKESGQRFINVMLFKDSV